MRKLYPILILLLLCACESFGGGSTTTQRPALSRPAIGPDGAFWDATETARQGDKKAFLYLLSPQFLHRSLFPEAVLDEVTSQDEFDDQREEIQENLAPYQAVVDRLAAGYMKRLANMMDDKFVDVGRPRYDIDYTDQYDRADGPNKATVTVTIYPKGATEPGSEPETFDVSFIMDGRRWLIDGFNPDPLRGSFTR